MNEKDEEFKEGYIIAKKGLGYAELTEHSLADAIQWLNVSIEHNNTMSLFDAGRLKAFKERLLIRKLLGEDHEL